MIFLVIGMVVLALTPLYPSLTERVGRYYQTERGQRFVALLNTGFGAIFILIGIGMLVGLLPTGSSGSFSVVGSLVPAAIFIAFGAFIIFFRSGEPNHFVEFLLDPAGRMVMTLFWVAWGIALVIAGMQGLVPWSGR